MSTEIDFSTNGKCINCNECCSINIPLTKKEFKFIKKIVKNNKEDLLEFYRLFKEKGGHYLMCPFSSIETKKCLIYENRPSICKIYHCHNNKKNILDNLDIAVQKREYNLKDCMPKEIQKHIEEGYKILGERNEI